MTDKLFNISKHSDPTSYNDIYRVELDRYHMAKALKTDLFGSIINEIVANVSKTILEEQGEKIINDVLAIQNNIKEQIFDKIQSTIEPFVREVLEFRDLFISQCLCDICYEIHKATKYPNHYFVPMTNLTYLERRHDLSKQWIDSLK